MAGYEQTYQLAFNYNRVPIISHYNFNGKEKMKEVQKLVEKVEENTELAKQVVIAFKQGHAPIPRLEKTPPTSFMRALAKIEVEIIYKNFNTERRGTELEELRELVKIKTSELNAYGVWEWKQVGDSVPENTIDRVCNALASEKYYYSLLKLKGIPPLICDRPKRYWPNPARFEDESKEKLEKLLQLCRLCEKTGFELEEELETCAVCGDKFCDECRCQECKPYDYNPTDYPQYTKNPIHCDDCLHKNCVGDK